MKASDKYTGSLRYSRDINGIYRGRVESNVDPLKIGRVKVRVPMIHGIYSNGGVSLDGLPWATMATRSAGYDFGTFIVPEIGEYVFIMFEDNDPTKPVYFGSSYGTKSTVYKEYGPDAGGEWKGKKGANEVPSEAQKKIPSVKMIYKSRRGSKIYMDTDPKTERIVIQDKDEQGVEIDTTNSIVTIKSKTCMVELSDDRAFLGLKDSSNGVTYDVKSNHVYVTNGAGRVTLRPDGNVNINASNYVDIDSDVVRMSALDVTVIEKHGRV